MGKNSKTSVEGAYGNGERTSRTDDLRIENVMPLPPPEHLIRFFPIAGSPVESLIAATRESIRRIMRRDDDRLLVIMGPCSIHDPLAAVEYAKKLKIERDRFAGTLEVVMRVYFEKPRTTVGWKGLINDPYLDESYRIDEGLRIGRQLLLEINKLGVPAGRPRLFTADSTLRASRRPRLISKEPSRLGSLISPFHPTVVRDRKSVV